MTIGRVMSAVVCAVLLAACDDAPQEQGGATSAARTPSKVNVVPPEMVAAVSAGKSATAVGVHFALHSVPAAGTPLLIDIVIVPHVPFESMRVMFESRDGVTLGEGAVLGPVNNALPEKAIKHQLVVQPDREGVFMITAAVDTEGGEGSITRVFTIPVIVNAAPGAPAVAPAASPAPDPAPRNPGEPAAAPPPAS